MPRRRCGGQRRRDRGWRRGHRCHCRGCRRRRAGRRDIAGGGRDHRRLARSGGVAFLCGLTVSRFAMGVRGGCLRGFLFVPLALSAATLVRPALAFGTRGALAFDAPGILRLSGARARGLLFGAPGAVLFLRAGAVLFGVARFGAPGILLSLAPRAVLVWRTRILRFVGAGARPFLVAGILPFVVAGILLLGMASFQGPAGSESKHRGGSGRRARDGRAVCQEEGAGSGEDRGPRTRAAATGG
jgi:hypothetical protein